VLITYATALQGLSVATIAYCSVSLDKSEIMILMVIKRKALLTKRMCNIFLFHETTVQTFIICIL